MYVKSCFGVKMLVKIGIFICAAVVCVALPQQQGATPPPSPTSAPVSSVYCGETPSKILPCLGNPTLFKAGTAAKCKKSLSECDRVKCIFRESGWASAGDKVNKLKVAEFFNQYAIDHPEWSAAVQHLKLACLDKDLPAQGVTQDCAPYDVIHCIQTSFLRNAAASQWRTTPDCEYPRAYATSCPVCPDSCFATQVPYGTCNACLSLPRTP